MRKMRLGAPKEIGGKLRNAGGSCDPGATLAILSQPQRSYCFSARSGWSAPGQTTGRNSAAGVPAPLSISGTTRCGSDRSALDPNSKAGCLNTGLAPESGQTYLDATRRFPLPDRLFQYVQSEQVLGNPPRIGESDDPSLRDLEERVSWTVKDVTLTKSWSFRLSVVDAGFILAE
jgi:hypothetical protein